MLSTCKQLLHWNCMYYQLCQEGMQRTMIHEVVHGLIVGSQHNEWLAGCSSISALILIYIHIVCNLFGTFHFFKMMHARNRYYLIFHYINLTFNMQVCCSLNHCFIRGNTIWPRRLLSGWYFDPIFKNQ